jgi:hypothetical protein
MTCVWIEIIGPTQESVEQLVGLVTDLDTPRDCSGQGFEGDLWLSPISLDEVTFVESLTMGWYSMEMNKSYLD